jgi:hypothetical protein
MAQQWLEPDGVLRFSADFCPRTRFHQGSVADLPARDHPMAKDQSDMLERARQAEQRGNREGRDLWDRYAVHRAHVTAAILELAPAPGGRLCLLGAGNANDLDLEQLAAGFAEVHLVDIDPSAISRALGRQSAAARAKLRVHAPVDLSGLFRQLGARGPKRDLVSAGVAEVMAQLPADFDVVVSGCVLSQMSWALATLGGTDEPDPQLEQALLRIHLRTLIGLARPGGAGLLVADLVSSDRYPFDDVTPETDLRALVEHLSAERVAYTVSNLELIKQTFRRDEALVAGSEHPSIMGQPWFWTGRHDRTYLVYPLLFRRRS